MAPAAGCATPSGAATPEVARLLLAHAGHGALAAALIARGAEVDARADMGQTPLHLGATAGLARLLVEAGADPAAADDEHGTKPLTWARVGLEIHGDSPARRRLVDYLEQVTPGVG